MLPASGSELHIDHLSGYANSELSKHRQSLSSSFQVISFLSIFFFLYKLFISINSSFFFSKTELIVIESIEDDDNDTLVSVI